MDPGELICHANVIPDTHYLVYRNKKYPIKYDFFKYSSNFFRKHQAEILENPNIEIIDKNDNSNFELSDETITDFITFVQCNQIRLTCQNVVGLNYLSIKFEVPTLQKYTEDYIKKNHQLLVIDLLQNNETYAYFDKEQCEEIIASHLDEYIQDERLLNLQIPILYRILSKYYQNKPSHQTNQAIIEFLFKALNKYGRQASILFSDVDFGDARIDYVNRLLTEYSANFDFHFINSTMLQTLYDTHNEFIRREEEHQIEIEKLNETLNNEIERNQKLNDLISKHTIETQTLISNIQAEFLIEINNLKNELAKREANEEINRIKEEINSIKTLQKKEIEKREKMEQKQLEIPLFFKENEEFNGIFAYLTNLTKGNIHDNKTIEVTTSSNDSSAKNILDFNCDSCYEAEANNNAWICFDFKNRKVKVTGYSIKSHKDGKNKHQLKSWIIEISNNGQTWEKIDEHTNCPTLNGPSITGTFHVQPKDFSRYVRLFQTDTPWGGHDLWFHYIEFYGYLRE